MSREPHKEALFNKIALNRKLLKDCFTNLGEGEYSGLLWRFSIGVI